MEKELCMDCGGEFGLFDLTPCEGCGEAFCEDCTVVVWDDGGGGEKVYCKECAPPKK